jgi:hypothetical protein
MAIANGMPCDLARSRPVPFDRWRVGGALKHAGEVFGFPTAEGPNRIARVMSLVDATRLCHGADDTAGMKRLILRYGLKPLTIHDYLISGPEAWKSLRETFLGPKAAGRMPSLVTWLDLMIIAGKGTAQQAKKFYEYMLRAEVNSCVCAFSADMGIPISELIQIVKGGDPSEQGTWAHPLVMIDLGQWCDKRAHMKVTKAIYHWMATGQVPEGDIGVIYIVANIVRPVRKLHNRRMRGAIWNEPEDKGEAVQHIIDFQTAEFHRDHPEARWPKDFVAEMYRQGKITGQKITYREALRRMGMDAEAATMATMEQGREPYGLSDRTAIDFGHGFRPGFENAQKLGVTTFEAVMAAKSMLNGVSS